MYHTKYGKGDIIFDLVINSDAFVFPMDGVVAVNLEYEQYIFQTHLYHQVIQVERSTQGRMGYKLFLAHVHLLLFQSIKTETEEYLILHKCS